MAQRQVGTGAPGTVLDLAGQQTPVSKPVSYADALRPVICRKLVSNAPAPFGNSRGEGLVLSSGRDQSDRVVESIIG